MEADDLLAADTRVGSVEAIQTFIEESLQLLHVTRSQRFAEASACLLPVAGWLGLDVGRLMGPTIPAEDVTVAVAGQAIPQDAFTQLRRVDPARNRRIVTKSKLLDQMERGATVVVRNVDLHDEAVGLLAAGLQSQLSARVACTLFVTPPGYTGFAAHKDALEQVMLHISGVKRWTIWAASPETSAVGVTHADETSLLGEPCGGIDAEPGRLFAIAPGIFHKAVCGTEPSVHLSFSISRASVRDAVRELLLDADAETWWGKNLESDYSNASGAVADVRFALMEMASDELLIRRALAALETRQLGTH